MEGLPLGFAEARARPKTAEMVLSGGEGTVSKRSSWLISKCAALALAAWFEVPVETSSAMGGCGCISPVGKDSSDGAGGNGRDGDLSEDVSDSGDGRDGDISGGVSDSGDGGDGDISEGVIDSGDDGGGDGGIGNNRDGEDESWGALSNCSIGGCSASSGSASLPSPSAA